ncbi:hypothetical protein M422DRAFT_267539 [Sphaerobolus stellatus SS14]|uniref:Uncharacterized protein n=1 Tax=Sphaerobolus stellatus (strain SS14) TaxID=990650 RepID=A0A0C9V087_SPHS4|nr:hypothetical protein M422DRAFT_267539 [Sphaerobolus stellatus SS14]
MSHNRGPRRMQAEELSVADIEDSEPTTGDLTNSPSPSVDPEQSLRMLPVEHLDDPHAQAYGSLTVPSRVQSPSRVDVRPRTATQGLSPSRLAGASGTAHRGSPSHQEWLLSQPLRGAIPLREWKTDQSHTVTLAEYLLPEEILKNTSLYLLDNTEVVLAEAMEAMERLNTVFSQVRASMNRMSPRMKELFLVPASQAPGKTFEPEQTSMIEPDPGAGAEEHVRTTHSHVPGDQYSRAPLPQYIPEDIPHPARDEQGNDSQPRHGREVHTVYALDTPKAWCEPRSVNTRDRASLSANQVIQGVPESIEHSRHSMRDPQSIDMNALREEIKQTISATIKDKLHSDADSVTTVSQSIQALDANAQYWSDLSNKAARHSRRAYEMQLKLAEEKVNTLLHEKAPEEVLLEAAREARNICFQLDQNTRLREASLMPEQKVRFSADTGRNAPSPSRNYGVNPIREEHTPQPEDNASFG